jgi:hypothetical protein
LNRRPLVAVSVHWSSHHGKNRLAISPPFLVSFIANSTRKRPEPNWGKTMALLCLVCPIK